MRWLLRILCNGLVALSSLHCVGTMVIWARSYRDEWRIGAIAGSRGYGLLCERGMMQWKVLVYREPMAPTGTQYHFDYSKDLWPYRLSGAGGYELFNSFDGPFDLIVSHRLKRFAVYSGTGELNLGDSKDHFGAGHDYRFAMLLIPCWAMTAVWGSLPLVCGYRFGIRWWRARRRSPSACGGCGYDLRATPERCPECGMVRGVGVPIRDGA